MVEDLCQSERVDIMKIWYRRLCRIHSQPDEIINYIPEGQYYIGNKVGRYPSLENKNIAIDT